MPEIGVNSVLISINLAPCILPTRGSSVAGETIPDVPITSITRARCTASKALSKTSGSRASSNQTTSGRAFSPQPGHGGGSFSSGTFRSSQQSPQFVQRKRYFEPCISMISQRPAAVWRLSTFCVIKVKSEVCFSMVAKSK